MKSKFILFSWLSISFFVHLFAQPSINQIIIENDSVKLFNKFEVTVDFQASFNNPYDYEELLLQAIIKKPNEEIDTIDGFYTQSIAINESTGHTQVIGNPVLKIRYAPYTKGRFSFKLLLRDQTGSNESEEFDFLVLESENPGFVRKNNTNYLQFDQGGQYIPIGENMSWQNANVYFNYSDWISDLSQSGGNFLRLWHAHWGLGIEWIAGWNNHLGLKKYNQVASAYKDWLYDYCAENSVYVMLALQHHGQVSTAVNPNWNDNPYNVSRGGPCINTWDFFINEEAKALTKNRLRYIIARWGYSCSIMSWELFNEVEWTDNFTIYEEEIIDWHLEMAAYIRKKDVYGHLISTSFANDVGGERLWQNDLMDITQIHFYGNTGNIHQALVGGAKAMTERYNKPVLVGEFGLGSGDLTNNIDPDGIHLHNGMWASLFGGTMGTAMSWWWDQYIHPRNLYYHFTSLAKMTADIDFVDRNLKPVINSFSGATADLTLQPTLNWGVLADDFIDIKNGVVTPANPRLSLFLYGSEYNTQFRSPPVFKVVYPEEGKFSVHTGNSGATSPRIQISVDEEILMDQPAFVNQSYTVTIPEGTHTIKVDNSGTDWINIAHYFFEHIGTQGEAFTLLSENKKQGAGWVLNREYNHANILNGGITTPVSQGNLTIYGIPDIDFLITWLDPLSGDIIGEDYRSANNGELIIALPEFTWDLAFTYEPSSTTSTNTALEKINFKIYPNPVQAGGQLQVEFLQSTTKPFYSLYNSEGKIIALNQLYDHSVKIPESMNEGLYWFQFRMGKQVSSKPFIIIK